MGTSIAGHLTPEQIAQTQANQATMASTGASLPPPNRPFVFLAAFDGTNNDMNNVPLSGSPFQTNVANVYEQAEVAAKGSGGRLEARYYPGDGTGGENGGLYQAAISPTQAVRTAAESALGEFAVAASVYLKANPSATVADLSATAVGFSRGGITAIVFAQLLNERGLVLPDGTVVASPGVPVYGLAPIDPIKTGIGGDLSIPPNVKGDVLVVRSLYEDRKYFEAADYDGDSRVVTVTVLNNHVGSGGGDDRRGTAASVLEGVTGYRIGTRINIDVLNAQQQLHAAQRDLFKARTDTLMQSLRLKAAIGDLHADALQALNALLVAPAPGTGNTPSTSSPAP